MSNVTLYDDSKVSIDQKIVDMARVSFSKTHDQYTPEQKRGLIAP